MTSLSKGASDVEIEVTARIDVPSRTRCVTAARELDILPESARRVPVRTRIHLKFATTSVSTPGGKIHNAQRI